MSDLGYAMPCHCGAGTPDLIVMRSESHGTSNFYRCRECGFRGGAEFRPEVALREWNRAHGWVEHRDCYCGGKVESRVLGGEWIVICPDCHYSTRPWPTEAGAWLQWDQPKTARRKT